MLEAIKNHMAIRRLKRAGIFRGMTVTDRGGKAQTRFMIKHHGVTSCMSRRAAVQLAHTMERIRHADEMKMLVCDR